MKQSFKVKLAHILDNGDSIKFGCFIETDSYESAYELAQLQFSQAVKTLSNEKNIEIDKSKIATGSH